MLDPWQEKHELWLNRDTLINNGVGQNAENWQNHEIPWIEAAIGERTTILDAHDNWMIFFFEGNDNWMIVVCLIISHNPICVCIPFE